MYCSSCEATVRDGREGGAGADRFGHLQCQGCGVPLPIHVAPRALAEKLAQLARFGLAENRSAPKRA